MIGENEPNASSEDRTWDILVALHHTMASRRNQLRGSKFKIVLVPNHSMKPCPYSPIYLTKTNSSDDNTIEISNG